MNDKMIKLKPYEVAWSVAVFDKDDKAVRSHDFRSGIFIVNMDTTKQSIGDQLLEQIRDSVTRDTRYIEDLRLMEANYIGIHIRYTEPVVEELLKYSFYQD